jgi:hypothetical protein
VNTAQLKRIRLDVEVDLQLRRPGVGTIDVVSNGRKNIEIDFSSFGMLLQVPRSKLLHGILAATGSSLSFKLAGRRLATIPAVVTRIFI